MILPSPLRPDGPHSVTDGSRRYPVVDGIPFLRQGREALGESALGALDAGRPDDALALLLTDRDDWARGAALRPDDVRALTRGPAPSLRAAMQILGYGPVGDYFAYRWSDPTYLSGLALLGAGLPEQPQLVVEVACGIGHYLRELHARDIPALGVDVVFSKLWLARRYLAPDATLLCADVTSGLPIASGSASAVFCHDAFYFLADKPQVLAEMRRVSTGPLLLGHLHNRDAENLSAGAPLTVSEYAALLGDADLYDDGELTRAFLERRVPSARSADALRAVPALSAVVDPPAAATWDFSRPVGPLRANPLLSDGTTPRWPSARYAEEYGPASTYLHRELADPASAAAWSADLDDLTRRRVLLALPDQW